jgi:hypothetical protein
MSKVSLLVLIVPSWPGRKVAQHKMNHGRVLEKDNNFRILFQGKLFKHHRERDVWAENSRHKQ